ncbi:MAG: hypothetical protein NZ959_04485 [Armatimonadetes bacterium]|nr:hypothetical protein [Armatimonadota bacterium]MDW8121821.1 hypothetical protein [Armatimonadota bacterium]
MVLILKKIFSVSVLVALIGGVAAAQCALCKSAVVSSGDADLIKGLQMGIGLLLVTPYAVVGTIAFFIYRAVKANGAGQRRDGHGRDLYRAYSAN